MEDKNKPMYDENGMPIKKNIGLLDWLFNSRKTFNSFNMDEHKEKYESNSSINNQNSNEKLNYGQQQKETAKKLEEEKLDQENETYEQDYSDMKDLTDDRLDELLDEAANKQENENHTDPENSFFSEPEDNKSKTTTKEDLNVFEINANKTKLNIITTIIVIIYFLIQFYFSNL